jgi:hypothetical protein
VTAASVGARTAGVGKKLAEVGPDEFEKNMGRYLGEL